MNDIKPSVVVVEDEITIRRFVRMALEAEGCTVHECDSLHRGLIELGTRRPDLLILDLGLPDGDGVELIRDLRTWSDIPVIVLSARVTELEKVCALDAGADDYLTKPFGSAELLARVRAQLRRKAMPIGANTPVFQGDGLTVDLTRRVVEVDGTAVHLTPIEYRLLAYLIKHADVVLTHRQLLRDVWGPSHVEDSHYVRVFMAALRKKIERDPSQPRHILTEVGVGYRFVP